jgi:hypothetical protein
MVLRPGYGNPSRRVGCRCLIRGTAALYEGDDRLRVPATVFNALPNRSEAI